MVFYHPRFIVLQSSIFTTIGYNLSTHCQESWFCSHLSMIKMQSKSLPLCRHTHGSKGEKET